MSSAANAPGAAPKQLRAFLITLPSALSSKDIQVFDISNATASGTPPTSLAALAESLYDAHGAKHSPSQPAHLTLRCPSKLSSKHEVRDASDRVLAVWDAPVLAFGTSTLSFPEGSPDAAAAHDLSEIRPLGGRRRGVSFVKASVGFAWETAGDVEGKGRRCFALRKTVAGTESEVGFCYQKHGFKRVAVVMVDVGEVDALAAVVTCIAVLKRSDSFTK